MPEVLFLLALKCYALEQATVKHFSIGVKAFTLKL